MIIGRIVAGEKDLFHDLIRPYERAVYRIALTVLRNPAEAEDSAQETMLKAFRSLGSFSARSRFGTWLFAIAINEARNRVVRLTRSREESLAEECSRFGGGYTPAVLQDWRYLPAAEIERKQLAASIHNAIAELPSVYREVFTLRDLDLRAVDEVADILQVSNNVVRVRLHRARQMLQKRLAHLVNRHPGFANWGLTIGGIAAAVR